MMKSYGFLGFIGLTGLSAMFALSASAQDAPHVYISEINWAGSSLSTSDEWLELVNVGTEAVDLSHYVLTGTATGDGAIEIAEGTLLPAGKTLLIANYAANDPKSTLLISPDLVTTAISLPNSALEIFLTTPEGVVIDSYSDSGTPDYGANNPSTSIERQLTDLSWNSSQSSSGLSVAAQLGTPGSVNLPTPIVIDDPAPVEPEPATEPEPEPVIIIDPPAEVPEPVVVTDISCPPPVIPVCPETILVQDSVPVTPAISTPAEPVVIIESPVVTEENPIIDLPETSTEVPVVPVVDTPSVQKILPGELVINELVSDPLDGVEWVEFRNQSTRTLDLTGSTLLDASERVSELPDVELAPDALVVIENPNGNLNNGSETISLFDSYGTLLDTISYGSDQIPAPQDGESLARNEVGAWLITTATYQQPNIFSIESGTVLTPTEQVSDPSDSTDNQTYETNSNDANSPLGDSGTAPEGVAATNDAGAASAEPIHRIVAIAKSISASVQPAAKTTKAKDAAQATVISGTVATLPGTFGKQTLFLDGYEVYFNAATWPELAVGDIVQMSGTNGVSNGATRLKLANAEAISITGHTDLVPTPLDGSEISTAKHGSLVSVSGTVTGKSGDKLIILTEDGTQITAVSNKRTGANWSDVQSGSIIVSGILKHTDSGTTLNIRDKEDIHFTPSQTATITQLQKPKVKTSPLVGGGLLTGSLGALGTWYIRTRMGLLTWLPF
ncbi:MAG: lamin tail domain-containing protein [Patescibacteria group bacterium]